MKPYRFLLLVMTGLVLLTSSCVSARKVRYLSDMQKKGSVALNDKFEAVISPYDEIRIMIFANGEDDEEMIRPFNRYNGNMNNMNSNYGMGYLVDVNGNIEFPNLGQLHVAGLTRLQVQDYIHDQLVEKGLLNNPLIDVRFMKFTIYFLGSNGGGKAVNIPNERCTFLEALALSGDMSLYTKRSKIGVMREKNGKMVIHYLDPRSSDIFNDEFYLLQQNDIILTEPMGYIYFKEWMSNLGVALTPLTTVASVLAVVLAIKASVDQFKPTR